MRRYMLMLDDGSYGPLVPGQVYSEDHVPEGWEGTVGGLVKHYPKDWQEVGPTKKFRLLVNDPAYDPLMVFEEYPEDLIPEGWTQTVGDHAARYPKEWSEVKEYVFGEYLEKHLKTDFRNTDLGHFTGLAMQAFIHRKGVKREDIAELSVELAKQIIKRLRDEKA